MSAAATPTRLAQDPLSSLLRDLLHERIGVFFEDDRLDLMREKLQPEAERNGCRALLDYYYILKYEEKGPEEWRRVLDAFSVQETYFWREFDQIKWLVSEAVPAWFKANATPFRIWSAACASGEEPYTIAMALNEAGWGGYPIEIFGTDGSELALARAKARRYRERSFRASPPLIRVKYFTPDGDGMILAPEIASRVQFSWANLMELRNLAPMPPLNVIFCRNVFIYFSAATIKRVIPEFAARLLPRGALCVGSSESLLRLTDQFNLTDRKGASVYEKV